MSRPFSPYIDQAELDAELERILANHQNILIEPINDNGQIVAEQADIDSDSVSDNSDPDDASTSDAESLDSDEPASSSSGYSGSNDQSSDSNSSETSSDEETLVGDVPVVYVSDRFYMESLDSFMDAWYHTVTPDEDGFYRMEGLPGRFTPEAVQNWMHGIVLFAYQSLVYANGVAVINNRDRVILRHMQEVIDRYRKGMATQLPILDQFPQ
jgi:hypothetical protein